MFRRSVAQREFRTAATHAVGVFANAHGLEVERRRWKNPFAVSFVNQSSRLYLEGINYGGSARACVGSSADVFEAYDVLDVLALCCRNLVPSKERLMGQQKALDELAFCLSKCEAFGRIMGGDFGLFPRLDELREERGRRSWHALFPGKPYPYES